MRDQSKDSLQPTTREDNRTAASQAESEGMGLQNTLKIFIVTGDEDSEQGWHSKGEEQVDL